MTLIIAIMLSRNPEKKAAYNFFETLLCTTSVMKLSPIRAPFYRV